MCSTGSSQIDALVLVDRTVDPLTPLCTQLTYEGLIDETFHIKNGVVQAEVAGVSACVPSDGLHPLLPLQKCPAMPLSTVAGGSTHPC